MTDDTLRAALVKVAEMTSRAPHRSLPVYAVAVDALREYDAALAASATDEGPDAWTEGYRAGLNARPAEYRPAAPVALDVERLAEAYHAAHQSHDYASCEFKEEAHDRAEAIAREYAALRSKEPTLPGSYWTDPKG